MKLDYPATGRNKDFIVEVLKRYLPKQGTALEIASGSGQHICYFAQKFPELTWQPSDIDPEGQKSVDAWAEELKLKNVNKVIGLDAEKDWQVDNIDFLLCINMIHIAPWEATLGLFKQAAKTLKSGSNFYLYGPYIVDGIETAPSNIEFDHSLRYRNPSWGIRELSKVKEVAGENGFEFKEVIPMPANNYSVIFTKLS